MINKMMMKIRTKEGNKKILNKRKSRQNRTKTKN